MARNESFQAADVHTGFIPQHFDALFPKIEVSNNVLIQAAVALIINENNALLCNSINAGNINDVFAIEQSFRVNSNATRDVKFVFDAKEQIVSIVNDENDFKVQVNGGKWQKVQITNVEHENRFSMRSNIDGYLSNFSSIITPEVVTIFEDKVGKTELLLVQPKFLSASDTSSESKSSVTSPMPGVIDKILVAVGDEVKKGEPIAVIIGNEL